MKISDFVFRAILYPWLVLICTLGAIMMFSSGEIPVIFTGAMLVVGLAIAAIVSGIVGLLEKTLS